MRIVPDSITDGWLRQAKVGDARPVVRATVQRQNLRRYEYDTAWAPGGDYNNRHRAGHFHSMIFGDRSPIIEIRNIKSCEWERSVGQDAATCTLTLLNSEIVPIGSPRDNPSSPDEFDKPGYFTFNRGDTTISANRWGYDEETGWNGVLVPDMTVRTYEGYGADPSVKPPDDPYLVQSGTWLIDKVTYNANGDITVEMRDLARLLLDSVVFPPAIPFSEYPLSWTSIHSENVPGRDVSGGPWVDRLNRYGSASSSNDAYIGLDFTNHPFTRYVSDSGGVDGHHASDAIKYHDGDLDLFWRSTGQDTYHSFVWWEFTADDAMPVGAVRVNVVGGPFRMYISIHNGDKWLGKKKVPYHVSDDPDSPGSVDIDAKIPFVKSVIADRGHHFDVILPRAYHAKRVRLTFTRLREVAVGEHPFRAGLRELKLYTADSVGAISFVDGEVLTVVGNYSDYTQIVKWVCAWAGWYWPPHHTGDDFIRVRDDDDPPDPYEFVTFDNPDPTLPKGRVWGDFMRSGTTGVADLTTDLFDKKPLMDIINYVRDLLGFVFFIDELGAVVWRMPNLGMGGSPKLGNYLSPEDILDIDGNRRIGHRGRYARTSNIVTLDEETTLLGYQTALSSQNIRDRIFVANAVGGVGTVIKGFNPYPLGLTRTAGWTDQHFKNKHEARVMADMISAQQMFSYRVGQAVTPGNPAIQIDDQIRIFERVTNETFYHYVSGIKSTLDMEEGDWTYELDTHWLGERPSDAWVVKVDELSGATQRYLEAIGFDPADSNDNDFEPPPLVETPPPDGGIGGGDGGGDWGGGSGGGTTGGGTTGGGGTVERRIGIYMSGNNSGLDAFTSGWPKQPNHASFYLNWGSSLPSLMSTYATAGRTLQVGLSTKISSGSWVTWSDIAAGTYDSAIASMVTALDALPGTQEIMLSLDMAPDEQYDVGGSDPGVAAGQTPSQYVAAFNRFATVVHNNSTRVKTLLWLAGYRSTAVSLSFLPQLAKVDNVGWNPYSTGSNTSASLPTQRWATFINNVLVPNGYGAVPRRITETGIMVDPFSGGGAYTAAQQVEFYQDIPNAMDTLNIKSCIWFRDNSGAHDYIPLDAQVDTAFRDMLNGVTTSGGSVHTPGSTGPRRLGMYNGNSNESPDQDYHTQFGSYPMVTSSYYTTQGPNEAYEIARVERGTDVWLDFDTKSTPGQIGLIADRDATTMTNWVHRNLDAAQRIAAAGIAKGGGRVTVSFVHEWEVKLAQSVLTNSRDRNPATYAAAWDVIISEAHTRAPDVDLAYWLGNSAAGWESNVGAVFAAMTHHPDKVSWDPYVTVSRSSSTTPHQLFQSVYDFLESNSDYISWGRPTKCITEFAIAKQHGDAACATFYSLVEEAMIALDLGVCIQFNRDKNEPSGNWKITAGTTPNAKAAFGAEVTNVRGGD